MTTIEMTSLIAGDAHRVNIDPYARNPLADDYRQVNAGTYAMAVRAAGQPPKMFAGGTSDLPLFTAAGFDPQMLLKLPAYTRHYVAALDDRAAVAQIFEEYVSEPYARFDHHGLSEAIARFTAWASGRMDHTEQAGANG